MVVPLVALTGPLTKPFIIVIGRVTIRTINLTPKNTKTVAKALSTALRKVGIKPGSIDVDSTITRTIFRITGTTAELKAVAATVAGVITTYEVMIKDVKRKVIHKRKYILTRKQAAKLKKDGYVYITRNKKQVKITR